MRRPRREARPAQDRQGAMTRTRVSTTAANALASLRTIMLEATLTTWPRLSAGRELEPPVRAGCPDRSSARLNPEAAGRGSRRPRARDGAPAAQFFNWLRGPRPGCGAPRSSQRIAFEIVLSVTPKSTAIEWSLRPWARRAAAARARRWYAGSGTESRRTASSGRPARVRIVSLCVHSARSGYGVRHAHAVADSVGAEGSSAAPRTRVRLLVVPPACVRDGKHQCIVEQRSPPRKTAVSIS